MRIIIPHDPVTPSMPALGGDLRTDNDERASHRPLPPPAASAPFLPTEPLRPASSAVPLPPIEPRHGEPGSPPPPGAEPGTGPGRPERGVRAALALLLATTLVVVAAMVALRPGSSSGVLSSNVRLDRLMGSGSGLEAYRGLATWIDVYDYAPTYQAGDQPPPLTPAVVRGMAATGIRTLFLQTAGARTSGSLEQPELLGRFLSEAHGAGLRVVGWYVPTFADVEADLDRLLAAARFRAGTHRFDGLAVDVEATQAVADPGARNDRLLDLSRRLRDALGPDQTLGAIVPPPILLDDVNPELWPSFPWTQLHELYDVWMPMSYWTLRSPPHADAARYTAENIRRLRRAVGDPDAAVHVLGGLGDHATEEDYRRFLETAHRELALGLSIYDYRTTPAGALAILREVPAATVDSGEGGGDLRD